MPQRRTQNCYHQNQWPCYEAVLGFMRHMIHKAYVERWSYLRNDFFKIEKPSPWKDMWTSNCFIVSSEYYVCVNESLANPGFYILKSITLFFWAKTKQQQQKLQETVKNICLWGSKNHLLFKSSLLFYGSPIIITPISHMKKMKHRKVKKLNQRFSVGGKHKI